MFLDLVVSSLQVVSLTGSGLLSLEFDYHNFPYRLGQELQNDEVRARCLALDRAVLRTQATALTCVIIGGKRSNLLFWTRTFSNSFPTLYDQDRLKVELRSSQGAYMYHFRVG